VGNVKDGKDGAGGLDGLNNQSGKCEGLGGGGRQGKKPEWEMQRTRARGGTNFGTWISHSGLHMIQKHATSQCPKVTRTH